MTREHGMASDSSQGSGASFPYIQRRTIDNLGVLDDNTSVDEPGKARAKSALETIVLIEDQVDLNRALTSSLAHEGYNVVPAYDGVTGLIKAQYMNPDLILLDLGLPRLDGIPMLRRFRKKEDARSVPILVLTGDRDPQKIEDLYGMGVHSICRKPVSPRELVAVVNSILRGS